MTTRVWRPSRTSGNARDCEGGKPFPATPDQILATQILEAIVTSVETGERVQVG